MAELPRVIFFDAVGTLIHPEPSAPLVYATVGRRRGSRLELAAIRDRFAQAFRRQEELDRAAGNRTDEARELARWRAIVAEVLDDVDDGEACFQELYAHFAEPSAWRCAEETADVLGRLAARGCTLGLASNFDARLCGLAEQLPALAPVQQVVVSSLIGWRKPAPEFFEVLCRSVGRPPAEVLFVGDDESNDYHGARAVGMPVLLLDPHAAAAIPPTVRIHHLGDILARYP